jgi:hypothetical protein
LAAGLDYVNLANLPAGAHLREEALARRFGLSRFALRFYPEYEV